MINQRIGNYRILRLIARGGMGVVCEAEHERIHTRVAVKVLPCYDSDDAELVERLFTEAKAVNQVAHPGIVKIQDCGSLSDGTPYLIMELLHGEPLRKRLDRGPLSAAERPLLIHIAEAMAAAHDRGIVHRDLSPNNVMLLAAPDGQTPPIKILDFGFAKVSEELRSRGASRPRTTGFLGTAEYTAPEQWEDASKVNDRADVYALGAILYEALAGRRPFKGTQLELMRLHTMEPPPPLTASDIPPALAALCLEMLGKRPADRPSMREVAERLRPRPAPRALTRVGNFKLGRKLGQGAYGAVHEASHEHLDERRAIKVLRLGVPEQAVQRFFNEAKSASRVRHPGIVEIFDCGTTAEQPYLVMELLPDGSLQDLLNRGEEAPLALYQQVAEAIAAANEKGIVHRDLKPDNIMLRRTQQGLQAKVVDFGIAKLDAAHFGSVVKRVQSQKGQPLGTPRYMAPEQWTDASSINDRADVYSLGVMLYQALSGRVPFPGKTQLQLMMQHLKEAPPPLPAEQPLAPLVMRMLSKDPAQRPSMTAVARALSLGPAIASGVKDEEVTTLKEATGTLSPRGEKTPGVILVGSGLSCLLLVALAIGAARTATPKDPGGAAGHSLNLGAPTSPDLAPPPLMPAPVLVLLRTNKEGATVYRKEASVPLGDTGKTGLPLALAPGEVLELVVRKEAYQAVSLSVSAKDVPEKLVTLKPDL